jgi:citrate lyase synthetase
MVESYTKAELRKTMVKKGTNLFSYFTILSTLASFNVSGATFPEVQNHLDSNHVSVIRCPLRFLTFLQNVKSCAALTAPVGRLGAPLT